MTRDLGTGRVIVKGRTALREVTIWTVNVRGVRSLQNIAALGPLLLHRRHFCTGVFSGISGPSCLGVPPFIHDGGSRWFVERSFSLQTNSIMS